MNRNELNEVYQKLESKMHEITTPFLSLHKGHPFTCGYYSGHYFKNPNGEYTMDYFPIPVISLEKLCDIEIGLDNISLSTKLPRDLALKFDYNKLCDYHFEIYGVEEYLEDFYTKGNPIQELISNISNSSEKEIGISFQFAWDVTSEQIERLVRLLKKEGFYY